MQPAQDRLAADLAALTFHDPAIPVMCNVDATLVTTAEQARDALIRQVTGAVQWHKSMRGLIGAGSAKLRRGRPGKGSVRIDEADRQVAQLLQCRGRGFTAEDSEPFESGLTQT